MTLADLAAVLGLAVLAVVYVGFRLGEKGGCPSCGGPGACARPTGECRTTEEEESARGPGKGTTHGTTETTRSTTDTPPSPRGRGR